MPARLRALPLTLKGVEDAYKQERQRSRQRDGLLCLRKLVSRAFFYSTLYS